VQRPGIADLSVCGRREIAETAVRSVPPKRQGLAGLGQRTEKLLIQQLVAELPIEPFHEGVLLAESDVMPLDLPFLRPAKDRHASQLGPVIRDDHRRMPRVRIKSSSSRTTRKPGKNCICGQCQTFAGEVVDNR